MSVESFKQDSQSLQVFACPQDYTPSRFFVRYNKSFVAPIYRLNLEELGQKTGVDTVQQWGWTFDQLADEVGLRRDAANFSSYVADHREGAIPCASSRVSEVFRSAYLRVLKALLLAKKIDEPEFRLLSAIVCPLDFSFSEIGAVAKPSWWPQSPPRKEGLQTTEEWTETSKLALRDVDGKALLYAVGPTSSSKDDLQSVRFSLIPFAYQVVGPDLPSLEEISWILRRPAWSLRSSYPNQLAFFDAPMREWVPDDHEGIQMHDLRVLPLLAHIESANINCWQYDRGLNRLVLPVAYLAQRCAFARDSRSWNLRQASQTVFSGCSWSSGPMQRLSFHFNECGQFATVGRAWLEGQLQKMGLKLGFVLKHEYRIRKSEYSEQEESSFYKLVNFESLIVP